MSPLTGYNSFTFLNSKEMCGLKSSSKCMQGRLCLSFLFHHHHYVPSVVNRSAVMDLHRSRSCATLIQSLYDIFVHSLMLSVHIVLGLPRPLLPFILHSYLYLFKAGMQHTMVVSDMTLNDST